MLNGVPINGRLVIVLWLPGVRPPLTLLLLFIRSKIPLIVQEWYNNNNNKKKQVIIIKKQNERLTGEEVSQCVESVSFIDLVIALSNKLLKHQALIYDVLKRSEWTRSRSRSTTY